MRKYRLIINPFAEIDMEVAQEWYNVQKDNLGDEFIAELEKVLSNIISNPFQFPLKQRGIHKSVINRFPFTVFFTVQNDVIIVFAVFHNSRNPLVWKSRLRE